MDNAGCFGDIELGRLLTSVWEEVHARRPRFSGLSLDPACDGCVSPQQATCIGVVVREAILNSIDHAFPIGHPGKVRVQCVRDSSGSILIEILDDGSGFLFGFEPSWDGGNGLQQMRRAAAEIGGELAFDWSDAGLTVSLRLPVTASACRESRGSISEADCRRFYDSPLPGSTSADPAQA